MHSSLFRSRSLFPVPSFCKAPAWIMLALLAFYVWHQPVRDAYTKAALMGLLITFWSGGVAWSWRRRSLTLLTVGLPVALAAFVGLAPGPPDPGAVRAQYLRSLVSYQGTPYYWGGETRRGIDCSGLLRCALIDAHLRVGLKQLNAHHLRRAAGLWLWDSSARALMYGERNQTRALFTAATLNTLDHTRITPGDFMVTASRAHTMAYLGRNYWIEAEPNQILGDRVILLRAPSQVGWFRQRCVLLRWRDLE